MKVHKVSAAKNEKQKTRVAVYCRVSTTRAEQEDSLEVQQSTYMTYITSNPKWEFAGMYTDTRSGLNASKRPGFLQMIRDAEDGKIDMILCKSISRFSRNIVECQRYTERLRAKNVIVVFEKKHSDRCTDQQSDFLPDVRHRARRESFHQREHQNGKSP